MEVLRCPKTSDVVHVKPISKERVTELLRLQLAEFSKAEKETSKGEKKMCFHENL